MLDLSIVMWTFTRGYMGYISSMWMIIHGTRTSPAASTSPTAAPSTRRPEAGAGRLGRAAEAFPWADAVDGQDSSYWNDTFHHGKSWKIMENHGNGGFHQWENPKNRWFRMAKSYEKWWFGGTPISGNLHMCGHRWNIMNIDCGKKL